MIRIIIVQLVCLIPLIGLFFISPIHPHR